MTGNGTILAETQGFTPVIDILAQELGVGPALVYGIVWRYCQMEDRVCYASRETIAAHAGISIKTVNRHLKTLCGAGYLKDLTPDLKHKPHTYADTGRVRIEALIQATGGTKSPTSEGRTKSPTRSDNLSHPGRTKSPIRKDSYERKRKGGSPSSSAKTETRRKQVEHLIEH